MSFLEGKFAPPAETTFRPQLTSLVDVMTILLVFLIKSFSVEGNLITPADDLQLPVSTSEKPPNPSSSIEITKTAIIADGHTIITINKIIQSDSLLIVPLFNWMKVERSRSTDISTVPKVLIQCDREIEFSIVKKVMFSCSKAGFSDFSVLVIQEE
jgi:biopolymer transport protein ExbD